MDPDDAVELPEECLDLFDSPLLADLATVAPDGAPHITPLWLMRRGDQLVFNTTLSRAKTANLRNDPRAAVCVRDAADPLRYVQVQGRVTLSTEGAERTIDELSHQYTGSGFRPLAAGEVRIDAILTPEYVDYHPEADQSKAIRVRAQQTS